MFNLKKYRGVIFYGKEDWCQIWRKTHYGLENDMGNIANFHLYTWKSQIETLMGSFNPKYKKYELKIFGGVMCDATEKWCKIWRVIDLPFQN